MRIGDLDLSRKDGEDVLSARVGERRIWFAVPAGEPLVPRGDAFVVAGLLGAMAAGETVEVEAGVPLSPRLLDGIAAAQRILHGWNPVLRVAPVAGGRPEPHVAPRPGEAVFFSGGVDGTYSFLVHRETVTHLLFLHGLEIPVANQDRYARALDRNRETAAAFGKVLLPLRTNAREIAAAHLISNRLFHGPLLGAAAAVAGFPTTYVAATYTSAHLFPWGSHPSLDPLWSTEGVAVVHDGGDAARSEKLARIVRSPEALRRLRVCLSDDAEYNCGHCSKCLRTRVALRLLGASCPTLPPLHDLRELRGVLGRGSHESIWLEDNLALARRVGDREMARALAGPLRRARLLEGLQALDRAVFGGRLRRGWDRRRRRPGDPEIHPEAR